MERTTEHVEKTGLIGNVECAGHPVDDGDDNDDADASGGQEIPDFKEFTQNECNIDFW
jgi:hypothetical protein